MDSSNPYAGGGSMSLELSSIVGSDGFFTGTAVWVGASVRRESSAIVRRTSSLIAAAFG